MALSRREEKRAEHSELSRCPILYSARVPPCVDTGNEPVDHNRESSHDVSPCSSDNDCKIRGIPTKKSGDGME